MCYTAETKSELAKLKKRFLSDQTQEVARAELDALVSGRFSGFEHPRLPVITNAEPDRIQFLTWGLVPHWATPDRVKDLMNQTLNARAESIFEKPSFKDAARLRRCLILLDGFFEWQHRAGGKKQPYFIRRPDEEPFAVAGLWSEWTDRQTGEVLRTCSIVTTEANGLMSQIHNTKKRMPLILPREAERAWLANLPAVEVQSLLVPLPDGELIADEVAMVGTRGFEFVPAN